MQAFLLEPVQSAYLVGISMQLLAGDSFGCHGALWVSVPGIQRTAQEGKVKSSHDDLTDLEVIGYLRSFSKLSFFSKERSNNKNNNKNKNLKPHFSVHESFLVLLTLVEVTAVLSGSGTGATRSFIAI